MAVALALSTVLGAYWMKPAAAHANVDSVTGSALGYEFRGTFFGGPQSSGPDPTVSIPASGGNSTATDPDGVEYVIGGAAVVYHSGATTVSSSGTIGVNGSVTSSSRVVGYQDPAESPPDANGEGPDPFTWQDLTGTCTAGTSGATASTAIATGVVVTSTHPTTGDPVTTVNVPSSPAPNTVVNGTINHTPGGVATFSVTFNEQSTSNGVLTVTAAHMRFLSGPLLGDLWIGQAKCGVVTSPLPHAPVAGDDSYSTAYQTPLTVAAPGVLLNDTDGDNEALTAEMPTIPTSGTVNLNTDGSFTYTPAAGFSGTATFEYMVHDPTGRMDTGLVTIAVGSGPPPPPPNQPPDAVNDTYSTPYQTVLTVASPGVLTNDVDPEGGALMAGMPSTPTSGSVTLNTNGSFTYTPAAGFTGTATFTYMAHDPANAMDTATVTITVGAAPNQAPVANPNTYSTPYQTQLNVAAPGVLGNDSDPEGGVLTAVNASTPSSGTVALNANGSFTYTPAAGFSGNATFTYAARDAANATSAPATVTVTVGAAPPPPPNEAPVANDDGYSTAYQTALNVAAPGVLANDTDANSDALTAQLQSGPANGTLVLNANGSFSYTPATGFSGSDSFTYVARDPSNAVDGATVTISVGAAPPPPASADLAVSISDIPDPVDSRNTLTYTISVANNGPDGATGGLVTFDAPTGTRLQSSAGAACVELRGKMKGVACDVGDLASGATATFTVVVTAPAKPGTLVAVATVSATTSDPVATNNSATEETVVQRPTA